MMFLLTGVTEPKINTAALTSRDADYGALSGALSTLHGETVAARDRVLAQNDGPAASAFQQTMSGAASITEHISELVTHASTTATTHRGIAKLSDTISKAMYVRADAGEQILRRALKGFPPNPVLWWRIVSDTKDDLQTLEDFAVDKINTAFQQLVLPLSFTGMEDSSVFFADDENKSGYYDEGIEEAWNELTREEREAVLQKIADQYAADNDIPPITVEYDSLTSSTPGGVTIGGYTHGPPPVLELNEDLLMQDGSHYLIGTVVHEMQHRAQRTGMDPRPNGEDVVAGMSAEDAERWRNMNTNEVRRTQDWPDYLPRPVEVDARQAQRDFVNNLTTEEFLEYL